MRSRFPVLLSWFSEVRRYERKESLPNITEDGGGRPRKQRQSIPRELVRRWLSPYPPPETMVLSSQHFCVTIPFDRASES